jgi:hypothetical protein
MRTNTFGQVKDRRITTVVVFLIIASLSCKKFVEVSPPNTELIATDVFSSNGTSTSAVIAIYTKMFSNAESWTIAQNQGLLADELTSYSTFPAQELFYTNSMTPTGSSGEWDNGYNYIYQANAIIQNLQNNGNISPSVAQQLTGEAKFIRAFWHFYLTNEYGDIPLITSTLYTINQSTSRTPQTQVYVQIIKDLKDAENELNANYVDGTDTTVTTERTRPNKAAAEALLARVYLYSGQYDSAETQANLVIGNSLYGLCAITPTVTNGTFLENSTEAIWQLATPLPTTVNTDDAQNFVLHSAPGTGVSKSTCLSPELLNSFEIGDKRRQYWIDSFMTTATSVVVYYYPYKYQAYNTGTVTEYTMVLRLAEQYLIRAEAEAQLGNLGGASADLNTVRNRAGLANIADSISKSETYLLAAILHEREVELFTEWGHRWFDLKRTSNINAVMSTVTPVKSKGSVSWTSTDQLYPIPQSEITDDPNLSQNNGY